MDGRCEYKFLLDKNTAEAFRERVAGRLEPDAYSGGLPYTISSLYFDSPGRKLYYQTHDRSPCRYKLRLRVYGEANDSESVSFFEIKSKLEGLSVKRRLKLPLAVNERLWQGRTIPGGLSPSDLSLSRSILFLLDSEKLAPASVVSYDRLAYCGYGESNLRVTFDSGLRIRVSDLELRHGSHGTPVMGDEIVLEVKSFTSVPLWLTRLFGEFGLCNISYSKYGKTIFDTVKEKQYV